MKKIVFAFLTIILSQNIYSQFKLNIANYNAVSIYPDTISPKIDFSEIETLIGKGLPREALKSLKKLEIESLKKKNPTEYSQILNRYSSIFEQGMFENEEFQKMIWEYSNEVEQLSFPYNNILHHYLQNWIQELNYNDALTYDEESLLWNINGKTTKLKNRLFNELYLYHKFQSIKNPAELMKFAAKGFILTNTIHSKYAFNSLFEALANSFFISNDILTENVPSTIKNVTYLMGKTEDILKIENNLDSNNTAFQLSYYLENFCLTNKNYNGYAYWVNKRINLAYSVIQLDEKNVYRSNAYRFFEKELIDSPASSLFTLLIASELISEGNQYESIKNEKPKFYLRDAYSKIENSVNKYPNSLYSVELLDAKNAILSSKVDANIKNIEVINEAILYNVNYQNIDSVHLKIYHLEKFIRYHENNLKDYSLKEIYYRKLTFSRDSLFLPHNKDFILPALSQSGKYLIIYADKKEKIDSILKSQSLYANSKFGYDIFTLSNLNVSTKSNGANFELLLTNIKTGQPIKGAAVQFIRRDYQTEDITFKNKSYTTDKNGLISVNLPSASFEYIIRYGKDSVKNYFWHSGDAKRLDNNRAVHSIFLDRAIYRPGQTVHLKAVQCYQNTETNEVKPIEHSTLTVRDQNDFIIWNEIIYFNKFGSAATSFVLPKNGFLLGNCTINISDFDANYVSKNFVVEEYKRPTFEVKFDEIQGKVKLGESIQLSGNVKAFAGFPIANAKVKVTIVQNNYFPRWCMFNENDAVFQQEIELLTDINGNFNFKYTPIAKEKMFGSSFSFQATVTDITGEVQEGNKSIYVGNRSYSFQFDIAENLVSDKKNEVVIKVENSENQEFKEAKIDFAIVKRNAKKWYPLTLSPAEFSDFNAATFQKKFPLIQYYPNQNTISFDTIAKGILSSSAILNLNSYLKKEAGDYELVLKMKDDAGEILEEKASFQWIDPISKKKQHKEDFWIYSSTNSAKIGDTINLIIGSSYKKLPVFIEINNEKNTIKKEWISLKTKKVIQHIVTKEDVNGIAFNCIAAQNGIVLSKFFHIDVKDDSKKLTVQLQTVRDYLTPGEKEKWNVNISNQNGIEKNAELLVGMYDASLDQFIANSWENNFNYNYHPINYWQKIGSANYSNNYSNWSKMISLNFINDDLQGKSHLLRNRNYLAKAAPIYDMEVADVALSDSAMQFEDEDIRKEKKSNPKEKSDLTEQNTRSNFNETAFFYPTIYADSTGNYRFEYTLPDALTKWRFMAMAHTKDLKSGSAEYFFKAKKEVMIEPNEPRFFREKDSLVFASKIINLTDKEQDFTAQLRFIDPLTNKDVTNLFGQINAQKVHVKANTSSDVNWVLQIPSKQLSLVAYEISASNEHFSDLERKAIPILSNRMLVTTSKAFVKTKAGEQTFTLDKINQLSATTEKISIALEMQTQPLWTTLLSLPYLMEYPYECAEQTFARYFANSIALQIIKNNPEFKSIIESWKTTDPNAFLSELEKNPDLKSIILSETPWILEAQNESNQRKKLSLLFDINNLENSQLIALQKLKNLQIPDGGWSWYGGQVANVYITQYIVSGLKSLLDRGIQFDKSFLNQADSYLERYYQTEYSNLSKEQKAKKEGLSALHIQWLNSTETANFNNDVKNYYTACLISNWTKFNLQTQAIAGLYAVKVGNSNLATQIKKSVLDRATIRTDLGMYWNENKSGYYWNESPIETQSYLIQFFGNFPELEKEVRQMQLWLLQQKRTNSWETTRATTLACMSLFVNSGLKTSQLAQSVKVKFADGTDLGTLKKESASNFKYTGKDISNGKATVIVESQTDSPIFGAIYLQYTDEVSKIEKSAGDIRVQRYYYQIKNGKEIELKPNTPLEIGAVIKVKLVVTTNNGMEYVHLKDPKGAGFEGRDVLSNYHYTSVGYYQMSKDASTEFFIDYLPKGTHTFEYEIFATNKGSIQVGAAEVECMYAPSFRANSAGYKFLVK